ncbi:MAG: hypothetical protein OWS74_02635 [Firmicutes bacterium]|nr:hypothetical protein [Bacillota bacterium]
MVWEKLMHPAYLVAGWSSVIVAIAVLGGAQLILLGILGEYVGHLFVQTQKRPAYLVDRIVRSAAQNESSSASSFSLKKKKNVAPWLK